MLFIRKGFLLQGHVTMLWKLIDYISQLNLLAGSCSDPYLCLNEGSRHEYLIYLGQLRKCMIDDINCNIYLFYFILSSKMEKHAQHFMQCLLQYMPTICVTLFVLVVCTTTQNCLGFVHSPWLVTNRGLGLSYPTYVQTQLTVQSDRFEV